MSSIDMSINPLHIIYHLISSKSRVRFINRSKPQLSKVKLIIQEKFRIKLF